MGEHQVEVGALAAQRLDFRDPFRLHAQGQAGAEVEKCSEAGGLRRSGEQRGGIVALLHAERAPDVVVHGREPCRIRHPFERFEVELREVHAVPVEALDERPDTARRLAEAVAVGEIHELAPVELRVLKDRGFLAPLGMIVPEALADVGQLEPGVDQDGAAMAGGDEAAQVFVALGVGLEVVPGGGVDRGNAGALPAFGQVVEVGAQAV